MSNADAILPAEFQGANRPVNWSGHLARVDAFAVLNVEYLDALSPGCPYGNSAHLVSRTIHTAVSLSATLSDQMHSEAPMNVTRIYPHRQTRDGSYESICLTCFLTISRANTESELRVQEEAHVCSGSLFTTRGDYKREHLNFRAAHGHTT